MDTVKEMEAQGSESGTPKQYVQIIDCYDPTLTQAWRFK